MNPSRFAAFAALAGVSTLLTGCDLKDKAIKKHISPAAISGFLDLEGPLAELVDEYCTAKFNMSSLPEKIWWPGCGLVSSMDDFKSKEDGGKCAPLKDGGCVDKAVMEAMDKFNNENVGKKVNYKSREGKTSDGKDIEVVDLTGWWLPAPDATADTPRIVVQHGFTSNSNKFRTMFVAYLLRKIGYSVLVNNLRDHCYSDDTKEKLVAWGQAYPLDLLGAWDFLKDHADKPIDASKVGILGFSMGGFTTNNAFGLEPKIPGVWIDGAPMTPKAGFEVGFKKALGPAAFLNGHIKDNVWKHVEEAAKEKGINLNDNLPEDVLPKGPDTNRPIFVTHNKQDSTVGYDNGEQLVALLKKYPKKYDLKEFWKLDGKCEKEDHCVDFLTHTDEYTSKLGKFWGEVIGKPAASKAAVADTKAATTAKATVAPKATAAATTAQVTVVTTTTGKPQESRLYSANGIPGAESDNHVPNFLSSPVLVSASVFGMLLGVVVIARRRSVPHIQEPVADLSGDSLE